MTSSKHYDWLCTQPVRPKPYGVPEPDEERPPWLRGIKRVLVWHPHFGAPNPGKWKINYEGDQFPFMKWAELLNRWVDMRDGVGVPNSLFFNNNY